MSVEEKLNNLEREVQECRENVGNKMLMMERDSIEKLTKLQVEVVNISAQLQTFVNHYQFAPVKLIAYGLAGGVLMTVLGAIMSKLVGL